MFYIMYPDGQLQEISKALVWVTFAISIAVLLAFYALRSVGLYKMAQKKGLDHAFIAFIPLVWVYTACKLIGKVRIFGSTFEKLAIAFCIICSLATVLNLFYQLIIYYPIIGNFLAGNELVIVTVTDSALVDTYTKNYQPIWGNFNIFGGANFVDPYPRMGIYPEVLSPLLTVSQYTSMILDLASLIIMISIYINLFKRYNPRHFILYAVLSWMGIFAPLVFSLRNREGRDYNDYVRERYNWYANHNPYGGQAPNGQPQAPSSPFEEFAEKDEIDPGNPFSDFEDKKDKGKDSDDFFD